MVQETNEDNEVYIKVCKECSIAIQVDKNNEHLWNFCYSCGKPLEWLEDTDHDRDFSTPY